MGPHLDAEFLSAPLSECADAALSAAVSMGAGFAEIRVMTTTSSAVTVRDRSLENSINDLVTGVGVRVLVDGTWGFAATTDVRPEAATTVAQQAVALARASRALTTTPVELAAEPVHRGTWVADYLVDPTGVPVREVADLLLDWSDLLLQSSGVSHTSCSFSGVKEQTFYANSDGAYLTQQRVRCHPEATAVSVGESGFEDMTTTAPPVGRGWEYALEPHWSTELSELPTHLAEKVAAPPLDPGRYDLVIHPSNLWLTIHESVGHATEYDRAIGLEANYAGTSFATPDLLGTLRYGSDLMNVTGDRTTPAGLSTVGWDDEGVAAQEWDLVREGLLMGYQLDRAGAARLGVERSNGCAYGDAATSVPLQRMPNVSLRADPRGADLAGLVGGVTDGVLVVGDKSWSIDMARYNFQFTAQRFYRIINGRLAGQVKDIAYQSSTPAFWNSLAAVGNADTFVLGGALNCGKGQPGQVAAVSHGCPAAVFEDVNILAAGGAL